MQKEFRQFLESAKGKSVIITSSNDLIKQFQIFKDFDFSINQFDCISVCNIEDENYTIEIYVSNSKTQVLIKDSVAIISNNDNINNNIVITVEDCEVNTI